MDDGCELASSCLNCPFPRCKEDVRPSEKYAQRREEKRREVIMARQPGESQQDVARTLGITLRTVQRRLRN